MDLSNWRGAPRPGRIVLEGRYARLEPLDPAKHEAELYESAHAPGAEERFLYLMENPPADRADFHEWMMKAAAGEDPLFYAVIDRKTGRAEGRQALMRIESAHGVIEIGHVLWGPAMARSRVPTEAFYLMASHAFALGYRRLEWKCNDANTPSKRAAERFGFTFEGMFRQHFVIKGRNRDSAWFSILGHEWPRLDAGFRKWLRPENFDDAGRQISKLAFRAG